MQSTSVWLTQLFKTALYQTFPVEQSLETVPEVTAVDATVPVNGNVIVLPETVATVWVALRAPLKIELDKPDIATRSLAANPELPPDSNPTLAAVLIVAVPPLTVTFIMLAEQSL